MEESTTPSKAPDSVKSYSVSKLYNSSWDLIKKNIKELAIITLIGVAVNIGITALVVFVIINNLSDGLSNAIVSGLIGVAVAILASIFVGVLQIVAIKKASEGKKILVSEVINESLKYVPVALRYGLFFVAIFVSTGIVIGILSNSAGSFLGSLLGLVMFVALIIALFRYAFVQFLILEEKPFGFMERFKVSQKLTSGIYGTLALMWLMALVLVVGSGFVGSIITSPFNETRAERSANVRLDLNNAEDYEDFRSAIKDVADEVDKETFTVNYFIREIIAQAISWGVGLIIIGALLELYRLRKTDVGI